MYMSDLPNGRDIERVILIGDRIATIAHEFGAPVSMIALRYQYCYFNRRFVQQKGT